MQVKLYTTPTCLRCNQLKEWLKREGINYEERSLLDSEVMADLIIRDIFVTSAPVLEYGNDILTAKQLFIGNQLNTELLKGLLKKEG
ncbi:MAG: glutaredoxin family protein [Candidatus Nezhaarchaeales archaeon]